MASGGAAGKEANAAPDNHVEQLPDSQHQISRYENFVRGADSEAGSDLVPVQSVTIIQ